MIGVVLLVAIAVTLMATIGTFVLGFGPGERAPNGELVSSQVNQSGSPHVNVTVAWAEGLHSDQVTIRVGNRDACTDFSTGWSGPLEAGNETTVTGYGDSACTDLSPSDTIRVVWSPQGSDRTEVIEEFEVI